MATSLVLGPLTEESMRQRSSFVLTPKRATRFQRLFAALLPCIAVLGAAPLYQFFASRIALTIIYYVSIGITVLINMVILAEIIASRIWFRRCQRLVENEARSLGRKHTAAIISAYLPNEPVSGLRETIRAAMKLQRAPGSRLTVVLGHNGGSESQMEKLKGMVKDLRSEIDEGDERFIDLVALHHSKSKSKAENVNGTMDYLAAPGVEFRPEVVALYDADHQPIPTSMKIACADLEALGADIVQGRCIIRSGSWIVGLEFDVIYSIFHSGGRLVRGFGLFGGTNGFWRFDVLDAIRLNPARLTEDIDSGIRAIRGGYKVTFNPMICSHEEAPRNFNSLTKQRLRWAQGWAEVARDHLPTSVERNPGLKLHSRVHLFLLLQLREVSPYFAVHAAIASVIFLTREPFQWSLLNLPVTLLSALKFILPATLMIVSASLTKGTHTHLKFRWYHRVSYVFIAPFYEVFKSSLTLWGHGRNIFGVTAWDVTTRSSVDKVEELSDSESEDIEAPETDKADSRTNSVDEASGGSHDLSVRTVDEQASPNMVLL